VHQVGDQPRLYYDVWSTNHQAKGRHVSNMVVTLKSFVCDKLVIILHQSFYTNLCTSFFKRSIKICINPLNPELNPMCCLLALLGAHHFLHVSRIRVKSLTFRRLMSYIYGAPILDVSRSHTTTQHSR